MYARSAIAPNVTRTIGGVSMTFSVRDTVIGQSLFLDRCWEPHLIALLPRYDLSGGVALDIGAHVGVYTTALSGLVGPAGRVIALEPNPATFSLLARNATADNITLLQKAASDRERTAVLVPNAKNSGDSRIGVAENGITVSAVTIDSLTRDLPRGSIRYIKVDVQGHEHAVLRGMGSTLESSPDAILQIEIAAGEDTPHIVEELERLGWRGFEIASNRFLPIQQPASYAWPLFRDQADLLLARDLDRLRSILYSSVAHN